MSLTCLNPFKVFVIFSIMSSVPSMDSRSFLIFSRPPPPSPSFTPLTTVAQSGVVQTSVRSVGVLVTNADGSLTRRNQGLGWGGGEDVKNLHFIYVLSILATFSLVLERSCSRYSPILTLFLSTPGYLLVFSWAHFGIFYAFVHIRLVNSFLATPPHSLRLSVTVTPGKTSPTMHNHVPPCHLQSTTRCAFGFHYCQPGRGPWVTGSCAFWYWSRCCWW